MLLDMRAPPWFSRLVVTLSGILYSRSIIRNMSLVRLTLYREKFWVVSSVIYIVLATCRLEKRLVAQT